jgi:hypothetical protein
VTKRPLSSPTQSAPAAWPIPAGSDPGGNLTVFITRFVAGETRWTVPPFRFVTQIEPRA